MCFTPGCLGRSLSVMVIVVLSVYAFELMYVFRAHGHVPYKMLSGQNCTLSFLCGPIEARNSSQYSSHEVLNWTILRTLTLKNSLTVKSSGTQNTAYMAESRSAFSVQANMKHTIQRDHFHFTNNNNKSDKTTYFRYRIHGIAETRLKEIITMFDLVMTNNHIDYTIYGGTLIGSYRHHGLVPWDDDADVLVPLSARHLMHRAFSNIDTEYVLNKDLESCWKLYSSFSDPIHGCSWKWPYLDIFFFAENETHIWDISPKYTTNFVYSKRIVFPLRRRPYMNLFLLAPRDPRAVIDTTYDIIYCSSGTWIHKWERLTQETTVLCSVLFYKFPFVQRTFVNGGCNETLVNNGEIVSYFYDQKVQC